ncbi:hypothetical protein [Microbacterium sp. SORGH_AS_0888]|uniref:hypothetical protein n=1 Tax=Microbacterium sp. SORGH_AS_0888 TaxID=3041791 RepID=UPI0027823BF0|nr:hypothetical protein [Microbacterium sp. SORGH_AS_0888]MDQ1130909.1 DNA-binding transcriptional ArsR family regulator [Microbacterium sp. SORGH_AS_0888]
MPAPSVPADAITVMTRAATRGLIQYMVKNPNSYYGEIREATEAPVSSLTRDLRLLESVGVVHTDVDHPLGSRRGRAPRYRVDVQRVTDLLAELKNQLLG